MLDRILSIQYGNKPISVKQLAELVERLDKPDHTRDSNTCCGDPSDCQDCTKTTQ